MGCMKKPTIPRSSLLVKTTQNALARAHEAVHCAMTLLNQVALDTFFALVSQGFDEQAIHFPPTFKHIPFSDDYSLKRTPSWTDRVLHMANADPSFLVLQPLYYRCVCMCLVSTMKLFTLALWYRRCRRGQGCTHPCDVVLPSGSTHAGVCPS
jgi:hypothetical protein